MIKKLQEFFKEHYIFTFIEKDRSMKCFYITAKLYNGYYHCTVYFNDIRDDKKFEEWKKLFILSYDIRNNKSKKGV